MEKNQNSTLIQPKSLHYGSYLKIPELLSLQHPLSRPEEHDEMLFILIHQVYELWFKQIIHESRLVSESFREGEAPKVLKILGRIKAIQKTLISQVDVLETMTPSDFARFRSLLNPASGFQSIQFRMVEFTFGLKDVDYLKFYSYDPAACLELEKVYRRPSVWDDFLLFLKNRAYPVDDDLLNRDVTQIYTGSESIQKILADVYEKPSHDYELYVVCESLLDLDQSFTFWRFRHVSMVERLIGARVGTGGSSGVSYLQGTLKKRFFPDLWALRNHLQSFAGQYGETYESRT